MLDCEELQLVSMSTLVQAQSGELQVCVRVLMFIFNGMDNANGNCRQANKSVGFVLIN